MKLHTKLITLPTLSYFMSTAQVLYTHDIHRKLLFKTADKFNFRRLARRTDLLDKRPSAILTLECLKKEGNETCIP